MPEQAPGAPAFGQSPQSQPSAPVQPPWTEQQPPGVSGPHPGVAGGPSGPQPPVQPQPPVGGSGPQPGAHAVPGTPDQQFPGHAQGPGQAHVPGQAFPGPGQPHVPAQPPFPQGPAPGPGQDLSSAQLLRQAKRTPQSGWRKAVYLLSGKTINLGESPADVRRRELISRINQPLHGCYKIAMLSLKGGVGKTTTTATLGSTFASLRGDRVIAVDANPDRGTLSQKIPAETTATVRHLLRDAHRVRKYSDVRSYTSQGPSRLEILASEQDPAVSEAFSEDDYRRTVTMLEHFYNVVLTDCGTGLMHSAMKGVLDVADSLVIVSSSSIDGARSASATLEWLDAHGYGQLVSRSVAVINSVRPAAGKVDVDKLAAHFGSRCRAVAKIPFDPHLEEGAEVELDQLAAPTRLALLELAAVVADDFQHAPGRQG
nr:MinD/ParA family protein [Saccharopolyspora sp. HNM0983]